MTENATSAADSKNSAPAEDNIKVVHEMPPVNKIDDEVKVESKYTYEENKTIDDIVAEADDIFRKYKTDMRNFRKTNKLPEKFNAKLSDYEKHLLDSEADRLLKVYQKKHEKFQQAYPIVLRFMIQTGKYDTGVFRRFMNNLAKKPYKSEEEYFSVYSEYAKSLHKFYNPRASADELKYVYDLTFRSLKEEKKAFNDTVKKYEKEYDDRVKEAIKLKKQLLIERLVKARLELANREVAKVINIIDSVADISAKEKQMKELIEASAKENNAAMAEINIIDGYASPEKPKSEDIGDFDLV